MRQSSKTLLNAGECSDAVRLLSRTLSRFVLFASCSWFVTISAACCLTNKVSRFDGAMRRQLNNKEKNDTRASAMKSDAKVMLFTLSMLAKYNAALAAVFGVDTERSD